MKSQFILLFLFLTFTISFAQVGVGNENPTVNFDARAKTGNSAIAFGNTNQTANIAGAGAMKYDNTPKKMYYSDGTNWIEVAENKPNTFIPKVVAAGRMTAQQTVAAGGIFRVWNFTDILVNDGNWDAINKSYTIPTTGFYQLSLTGGIKPDVDDNQSGWTIEINDHGNVYTRVTNTGSGSHLYFIYQGGTMVLYLPQGSIVRLGSAHCLGCTNNFTYLIEEGVFSISMIGIV